MGIVLSTTFFQLLQIALGHRRAFETSPTPEAWRALYEMSKKQALLGVMFTAVEQLPPDQQPPKPLLLQWYMLRRKIEQSNLLLNERCQTLQQRLRSEGYEGCVLKGQGVAQLYPQPLYRQCGDIDVWVRPMGKKLSLSRRRRVLIHWVKTCLDAQAQPVYHHIDAPFFDDAAVELHFTPSWQYHYAHNRRLQAWFESVADEQFVHTLGTLPTPTVQFNIIYLLLHIYRHIFNEGIGFRQMMDYYYALLAWNEQEQSGVEPAREALVWQLRELGLYSFATAVMWVLGEVFLLPRTAMFCAPDVEKGRFLLHEMLEAGNFGQYDERISRHFTDGSWDAFVLHFKRNLRFLRHYPSEVCFAPLFKVWHYFWRHAMRLRT